MADKDLDEVISVSVKICHVICPYYIPLFERCSGSKVEIFKHIRERAKILTPLCYEKLIECFSTPVRINRACHYYFYFYFSWVRLL